MDELCFQQSASDSTGPEIDVMQRAVGQYLANDDVGDLHASAWFEDAGEFRNRSIFLWDQIEHAI